MNGLELPRSTAAQKRRVWGLFALSLGSLTVYFFLWVGLLGEYEISFLYPFEGMQPLLILLAAAVFLGERLHWRAWCGIGLICAGIVLVSGS
ncbi:MAG: EamA family transporter, partial [Phycisphaerae bacterium]